VASSNVASCESGKSFANLTVIPSTTDKSVAFEAVLVSRVLSAKITRSNIFDSLLHPISATLLIYLIIYSWLMRGRIQWKGRTV
jgi:hypothetical protein